MTEETNLLERIDDVPAFLERAGKYHTSTAHQAYAVLKALDWHPWVKLGEELYFPEGSVLFAEVDPGQLCGGVARLSLGTDATYWGLRAVPWSLHV